MNTIEQPAVIIARPRNDFLQPMARGWRSLATALCTVLLFSGAALGKEPFDTTPHGKPTREDLPNGGYKEVYKNKKGERVKEEEFDGSGVKKRTKAIKGCHPNGKEEKVSVSKYGVTSKGTVYTPEIETTTYDKDGTPTERTVSKYNEKGEPATRTETTWPPGSGKDGVTRKYKWNPELKGPDLTGTPYEGVELKGNWEEEKPKKEKKEKKDRGDSSYTPRTENTAAFFRSSEVELRAFAVYAVGNAQETVSHTVHETRTVVRDKTVKKVVLEDIPGKPGLTPVTKEFVEPTEFRETVSRREDTTVGPFGDHAFGAGIDAKYFPCRHVGIGVEGDWLRAENDAWSVLATITARCPIEGRWHVAPYVVAGIGGQFADDSRLVGMVGLGVEKRFSPHCGAFVEARYLFDGNEENVCEIRTGISIVLGAGKNEPPGPVLIPPGTDDGYIQDNPRGEPPKPAAPPESDECAALLKKVQAADEEWWSRYLKHLNRIQEREEAEAAVIEASNPDYKAANEAYKKALNGRDEAKSSGSKKEVADAADALSHASSDLGKTPSGLPADSSPEQVAKFKELEKALDLANRREGSSGESASDARREFEKLRQQYTTKCDRKYRSKVDEAEKKAAKEKKKKGKKHE